MNSILRWSILQWRSVISLCEIATWCCTQEGRHMQRPSKKQTKTVDHKLMMTQDLNYVQLKLNVEQKVHTCYKIWNSLIEHTVMLKNLIWYLDTNYLSWSSIDGFLWFMYVFALKLTILNLPVFMCTYFQVLAIILFCVFCMCATVTVSGSS